MVIIVACHTNHGGFNFPASSITINHLWQQFIYMGGGLGNCIFVMLSGYFLIASEGISLRKLLNLWTRIFFWSVVIFCAFVYSGIVPFSFRSALRAFMPVTRSQWWFASTYFVMYLVHPYVNRLLHSFTREEYRKFLLSVMIYWCIIPMLTKSDFGANDTINFICVYSIAGYLRLYGVDLRGRKYLLYALGFIWINFMSTIFFDLIGLKIAIAAKGALYLHPMMRPFTIAAALCLLAGFRGLNIPYSKLINTIASATFGVYLIHDSNLVRPFLWHEVFRNASFQDSSYLIPYSVAVILIVYLVCTLLELVRSKIFMVISRGGLS